VVIQILIGLSFGVGIFFLLADLFKVPNLRVSKTFLHLAKRQREKTNKLEVILQNISGMIAERLRLNEYRRMQLESDLQSANIEISPELHIAKAVTKALLVSLLIIPCIYIFPLITPVAVALVFAMYFKESRGVQEKIREKREKIESELPRLAFTIEKTIPYNRDVLAILDGYKENVEEPLKSELNITVADMRSGNYEEALRRLESRVGSAMLSDVVVGLSSVIQGNETANYWNMLSMKFADYQRQQLKQQAMRIPAKVRRLSMVLMFCFLFFYIVVILVEILNSLGAIF